MLKPPLKKHFHKTLQVLRDICYGGSMFFGPTVEYRLPGLLRGAILFLFRHFQ